MGLRFALAITIDVPAGTVYKAIGRPGIILWLAVPRVVLVVASVGLLVDEGIVAVAACQAAVAVLFDIVGLALVARLLDVGLRAVLAEVWPPVLATAAMAAAVAPIDLAISSSWLSLAAAGAAGAVVYGLALWLLAPIRSGS